jgi:hypothetical protein
MERAAQAIPAQMAAESNVAAPPEGRDGQRLIEAADRLLRVQQARLTTARGDHERMRADRIAWYRSEMQQLADAAEHELVLLDQSHDEACRQINKMIGKLKALRAA